MRALNCLLFYFSFLIVSPLLGAKPVDKMQKVPPRIIRTCCAFGHKVSIVGVPFFRYSEVTELSSIGNHEYLGGSDEGNGIIYTQRGGFIDLGHLRDQADWTAYLYNLIRNNSSTDTIVLKLGREGGLKVLKIFPTDKISNNELVYLAGRIAYDLSVWHEIATGLGISEVPLYPERYSSFSLEDNYSNMLGVLLSMEALKSGKPYTEAMTDCLKNALDTLLAVPDYSKTVEAMDKVENIWWTPTYKIPSTNVTLKRDADVYRPAVPSLVPGWDCPEQPCVLKFPDEMLNDPNLCGSYSLELTLGRKIQRHIPGENHKKLVVNQNDFPRLVEYVVTDLTKRARPPKNIKKGV